MSLSTLKSLKCVVFYLAQEQMQYLAQTNETIAIETRIQHKTQNKDIFLKQRVQELSGEY